MSGLDHLQDISLGPLPQLILGHGYNVLPAQISDLPAKDLVPGDIVELHVGDRVPADMRVLYLRTATVRAEQSSLTGKGSLC
jgi:P-type E1-E2 ATPase